MPQVKEPLITRLVKEALAEAELTAGPDNTKFNIKVLVSNPQSETKLGIRIQLKPLEGFLEPDKKGQLEAAIMKKFNNSLEKFNLQISLDTDTQDPEAMGFFIPLPQIKNMIVSALGGTSEESPKPPVPSKIVPKDIDAPPDDKGLDKEPLNEMLVRELKRINKVVVKEDFYSFINAGNNVLRTLEENGIERGKKYLEYLVRNNIM
tara:strand:- start:298 stop:915 length:618 start_codon:yes stop_codon:yes gene_type:complete